ncbi:MAG: hypothetical protein ABSF43_11990 [Rectinemataceae bacterium]|jgi:transketolase
MMTIERIRELEAEAKEIRKLTIDEIGFLGVGHIGGAMSIVELLAYQYGGEMRADADLAREARTMLGA